MIELVVWRDAWFDKAGDMDVPDDYTLQTVGWVEVTGRWLRIRSEKMPESADVEYRAVTHVPLENVLSRTELVPLTPIEEVTTHVDR